MANVCEMSDKEIIQRGALALLKDGEMAEPELFKALGEWHKAVVTAILVELVINERIDMHWRDGKLLFGAKQS